MMVHTEAMLFRDRADAAGRLAEQLKARELVDPVVLAIPRGGVVIGAVLARCLGAELDVVLARKLRAPYQSEFAIGAVSEDGRMTLNPEAWDVPGVSEDYLEDERSFQLGEIARRARLFRAVKPEAGGRSIRHCDRRRDRDRFDDDRRAAVDPRPPSAGAAGGRAGRRTRSSGRGPPLVRRRGLSACSVRVPGGRPLLRRVRRRRGRRGRSLAPGIGKRRNRRSGGLRWIG